MANLTVDIITPEETYVEGLAANSVIAPGLRGEFEVLPDHTTFLSSLGTGRLVIAGGPETKTFVVQAGFAEVSQNHVRILADTVAAANDLDAASISDALKDIEAQITKADPFSDDADTLRQKQRFLELQRELS
jgi:F-type H+-transporting ATPase subunit epsilon